MATLSICFPSGPDQNRPSGLRWGDRGDGLAALQSTEQPKTASNPKGAGRPKAPPKDSKTNPKPKKPRKPVDNSRGDLAGLSMLINFPARRKLSRQYGDDDHDGPATLR